MVWQLLCNVIPVTKLHLVSMFVVFVPFVEFFHANNVQIAGLLCG